MIIVILIVCILAFVVGVNMTNNCRIDDIGIPIAIFGIFASLIAMGVAIWLGVTVSKLNVLDEAIIMYQEENAKIEEEVDILVNKYMDHETEIFDKSEIISPVVLVQFYPELKSDTLISSQINIYMKNDEQIKNLKMKKINGSVYRWWLYFGK